MKAAFLALVLIGAASCSSAASPDPNNPTKTSKPDAPAQVVVPPLITIHDSLNGVTCETIDSHFIWCTPDYLLRK